MYARDIELSKAICSCSIKKGMTLEEALDAVCKTIQCIESDINLDGVRLKDIGINNSCKLKYKNLLTEVLNAFIAQGIAFSTSLTNIQLQLQQAITTAAAIKDEKVKASASDTAAGYLDAKITTNQPGSIVYQNDKIIITGFVPIGSVFYISRSRTPDFDNTGKGRINTDLWGYAISNGANGTTNRLNRLIRCTDTLNNAGNTGGSDTRTLEAANIPSLSTNVTGTISDAIIDPIQLEMEFNNNKIADGSGGSVYLLRFTPPGTPGASVMKTRPYSFKHSHNHNLQANRTNSNVTPVNTLPSHILEIPIERISV